LPAQQVGERVWERREEFLTLNPAGDTPVLVVDGEAPVPGASVIAEYLDETYGSELGDCRLLPRDLSRRVEVRRLMDWFNGKFFAEVSGPLIAERFKQYMPLDAGGGSPDHAVLRAAREIMSYHLAYIDLLLMDEQDWLVGNRLTYADLAAAAHLSTADYLGKIAWSADGSGRTWYERMQSRPAFKAMMSEGWREFARLAGRA
jgi:glutathione S-transferase